MVTETSPKVKMIAEKELARLQEAEAKLKQLEEQEQAAKVDVPGGKITLGKRWDNSVGSSGGYVPAKFANIIVYKMQNETPVTATTTWKDKAGVEHPQYTIERMLRLPESVALKVFSGESKGGTLWYTPRRRSY